VKKKVEKEGKGGLGLRLEQEKGNCAKREEANFKARLGRV